MWNAPEINETVFLPIDVQEFFYEDLPVERRRVFTKGISAFSQGLGRVGVKTLPVANEGFSIRRGYYEAPHSAEAQGDLFKKLTFCPEGYCPQKNEAVFVKGYDDAFYASKLSSILDKAGTKNILVAGMSTQACVRQTILGAFRECKEDVCVHIVYDLLANACRSTFRCEEDPLEHRAYFEKHASFRESIAEGRLSFVTAQEALGRFYKKDQERRLQEANRSPIKRYARARIAALSCAGLI